MPLAKHEIALGAAWLRPDALPCPFCGGTDELRIQVDEHTKEDPSFVQCDTCGAMGPLADGPEKAATAWNERAATNGRRA